MIPTVIIRRIPIRIPGKNPPRNNRPTEVPVMLPKITKGMLGGIMGPMVEAAPTRAAEKTRGYPAFSMAGMRMLPVPTASATAAQDEEGDGEEREAGGAGIHPLRNHHQQIGEPQGQEAQDGREPHADSDG